MKTKYNLACGPLPLNIQHYKIMRDLNEWVLVDLYINDPSIKKWDITKLNEIPDESATHLYCSHGLEHIPHPQLASVFELWFNKLASGGQLTINVPDLIWVAERLLQFESGQYLSGVFSDFEGERGIQSIIYGSHAHEGEKHQSGFTKRSLREWLEGTGFKDIEIDRMVDAHEFGVIIATAKKP